jgi:hypothetical protein
MTPTPQGQEGWRPIPDPTLLTTQQLHRELGGLREILEARLDGMDKALALFHDLTDKIPSELDVRIAALIQIYDERFRSVQTQFSERGMRNDQNSRSAKDAVDAALVSAKEAVAKSELMTTKQLEQLHALMFAMRDAHNKTLEELKERVARNEGQDRGHAVAQGTHHTDRSFIVAVLAVLAAVAFGLIQVLR